MYQVFIGNLLYIESMIMIKKVNYRFMHQKECLKVLKEELKKH